MISFAVSFGESWTETSQVIYISNKYCSPRRRRGDILEREAIAAAKRMETGGSLFKFRTRDYSPRIELL